MRIVWSVLGVASVAVLLSGCLPPQPVLAPTPEPTSTPIFASDEEALAAAEAAYGAYVKLSDQIFMEGGVDPERLATVATGTFLAASITSFKTVQSQHLRSSGGTTFDSVDLQKFDGASADSSVVVVYLCEDVSAVDVTDAGGASVVAPNRPSRTRLVVTFDFAGSLLVSSREPWNIGDTTC